MVVTRYDFTASLHYPAVYFGFMFVNDERAAPVPSLQMVL